MLFLQVILPVFLIACASFVFERKSDTDISSLANSAPFLFAPSLVFPALVKQTVETEVISLLAAFMVLYAAILCLLAYTYSTLAQN